MTYPSRAPLQVRVRSVADVTGRMREIELVIGDETAAVQALELPAGAGAAYVAGESDTCRLVQRHLIEQRGRPRRASHTQPQWAAGRPGFGAGAQ